jgi:hypothetical protein
MAAATLPQGHKAAAFIPAQIKQAFFLNQYRNQHTARHQHNKSQPHTAMDSSIRITINRMVAHLTHSTTIIITDIMVITDIITAGNNTTNSSHHTKWRDFHLAICVSN